VAKVLLVDTNFSSGPILNMLRNAGHTVMFAGGNPRDFLAKATPGYEQLDYSNAGALADLCTRLGIEYLVPGCNDRSYYSCAEVAESLHFPGIDSLYATETINHKQKFRSFAQGEGLSVPRVFSADEKPACKVIVKPVDAYSGRGIAVVPSGDALLLEQAVKAAQAESRSGDCLVEEFVEGQLYSHSAFVVNGRVVQDFVVIEHGSANPFVVDTSHIAVDFPDDIHRRIRREIEHLAQSLRLCDGLVHTQFLLKDEKFWLVEITRRCPGDLYSQLIELSTGFPYVASYAKGFLGQRAAPGPAKQQFILRHTVTLPHEGLLQHLHFKHPLQMERWVPIASTGDLLAPSPVGRIALLFARCTNAAELQALANLALKRQLYTFNG
jgi:biotin carboxylase